MMSNATTALVPNETGGSRMTLPAPSSSIEQNPALAYLMSLGSKNSRRTMRSCLNTMARTMGYEDLQAFPWADLRRQHLQLMRETLSQAKRSPATINLYLSALRGVALEAWGMGLIDTTSYQHIKNVRPVRGSRLARGRALDSDESQLLLRTCEQDKACSGVRDAAILSIMLGCGLRRSEVVSLDMEHVDWSKEAIKVLGKGNKERLSFMPDGTVERLKRWVKEVRGDDPGALFTRIRRHDDVTSDRLTDQAIYYILQKRQQEADLNAVAPHDLRRTYATNLLNKNVDLLTVKEAMGHANLATTQQYDMRGHEELKKASKRLSV